jgi:hypothetical protein
VDLFGFVPGYRGVVFHEGKEPLFLSLLAFVITFSCTRGYTRLARKYGWAYALRVRHAFPASPGRSGRGQAVAHAARPRVLELISIGLQPIGVM